MTNKEIKTVKGLVADLRSIRDDLNVELEKMTSKQRREFFQKMRAKSQFSQQV